MELDEILLAFATLPLDRMKDCFDAMDQFLQAKTEKAKMFWLRELACYLPLEALFQRLLSQNQRSYKEDKTTDELKRFEPIENIVWQMSQACKDLMKQKQAERDSSSKQEQKGD